MQKLNITKAINIFCFDENDFVLQNQKVYDETIKILQSFDYDPLLAETKDYIENLNSDIFLSGKKIKIFQLKQNSKVVSFAVVENSVLKTIWTDFDFLKLGYATILLRGVAILQKSVSKTKLKCEINTENLVAENLLDSFSKIDGIKTDKKTEDNQITYLFDFCEIDENKILKDIQSFAL